MDIFEHLKKMKENHADPDPEKYVYHSSRYHNYFEDYIEYEMINAKGKLVTERKYIGDWYIETHERDKKRQLRAILAVLWLGCTALSVRSVSLPLDSNRVWYMVIFQLIKWAALLFGGIALWQFLPLEERITLDAYRSGYCRLKTLSLCTGTASLVMTLLMIICAFVKKDDSAAYLGGMLVELATLLLSAVQYVLLKKTGFTVEENQYGAQVRGVRIKAKKNEMQ